MHREFIEFLCWAYVGRLVDPDLRWNRKMFRRLPHETFRVRLIRHIENRLTLFEDACGLPVVNHGRREQCQAWPFSTKAFRLLYHLKR
jgi:hypothetical protein